MSFRGSQSIHSISGCNFYLSPYPSARYFAGSLTPLVSILLPVKNAAPWLDACIQSILNQELQDWECVVVDDHSTDHSLALISAYACFDSRFRIFSNEGNGLIDANKTLLRHARGKLVTRMDADDLMTPNRLHYMSEMLLQSAANTVVTAKVQFFPEQECGIGTRFYEQWLNGLCDTQTHWQHLWRECVIPSPCWMAKTEELIAAGGLDSPDYPEDYDMAFRLFAHGFSVRAVPEICHLWRQHSHRFSRSSHYSAEKFMALKWNWFSKLEWHKYQQLFLLGTGDKGKLLKGILQSEGIPFHWITQQPNVAGNTIHHLQIHLLNPDTIPSGSCVISTLSSIDNFDEVYAALDEARIPVYRFC